jgi:hypothetical protein
LKDRRKATGLTNDTTRLFGLAGVVVASVRLDADDNPMLALVTACEKARCCPRTPSASTASKTAADSAAASHLAAESAGPAAA